jgi:hypothetical protein
MKINELVKNLRTHLEAVSDERMEMIDFDSLSRDLKGTAEALLYLDCKGRLCDEFLADTKSEIKRMCLAVSRAKGDATALDLTERLLESEGLDYEDLILLKRQVKAEFDRAFPGKPVHKIMESGQSFDLKVGEFKIGRK